MKERDMHEKCLSKIVSSRNVSIQNNCQVSTKKEYNISQRQTDYLSCSFLFSVVILFSIII